jgi:uncharacterized membrane protein YdjX (TVP38/TMEM64 family)
VIALLLAGRRAAAVVPRFAGWVEGLGAWGPVVFIAGYALLCVALVPGSILTLAAGALFGVVRGTVYAFAAALLGASLAFLVARYVARAAVARRIAGDARFAAIDRAVGAEGRRIVALLRLSPIVPFNLLNYALGLTEVRFVDYLVGSLAMFPVTTLYVYYGRLAGDVAAAASGTTRPHRPADYAVLVVGLIATILVSTIVTRMARRALAGVADASVAR